MVADWTEVRKWWSCWHISSGIVEVLSGKGSLMLMPGKMPLKCVILKCKMQSSPCTSEMSRCAWLFLTWVLMIIMQQKFLGVTVQS